MTAKVSLVAPEDVGPAEAEAVILPRTPDEPLVEKKQACFFLMLRWIY